MSDTTQIPVQPSPIQDAIERDVRITIGDLHVQLIAARNQIASLEAQLAALQSAKPNGKGKEHQQ